MHTNTDDKQKIKIEEYTSMQIGGWTATVAGSIGLAVLLTVGIVTKTVLPTGLASLTVGACTTGCILLVGRIVLRKIGKLRAELAEHNANHQHPADDTKDLATIKRQGAEALGLLAVMRQESPPARVVAELHQRQDETERTLAEVAAKIDVAYTVGFTDGVGRSAD